MGKFEFKQRLLDDLIVVKLGDETKSAIAHVDWKRTLRGRVIAMGPGKMLPYGERAPMMCKVGDYVTFGATAGMDTVYDGVAVRMMKDVDVDAVLE
jgi:chaperonin GroES